MCWVLSKKGESHSLCKVIGSMKQYVTWTVECLWNAGWVEDDSPGCFMKFGKTPRPYWPTGKEWRDPNAVWEPASSKHRWVDGHWCEVPPAASFFSSVHSENEVSWSKVLRIQDADSRARWSAGSSAATQDGCSGSWSCHRARDRPASHL